MTKYRNHDPRSVLLAPQYGEHVSAMTRERLHDKAEIAEELAARDLEMARMRHRIECLRGGLKSAAGWLLDADDLAGHEKCLEMAGDMEPPLMGSNAKVTGSPALSASPRGLPGSAATRKSTTAPKCEKCGCPGVLNTGNADGGKSSEWRCWGWQCRHKWETPNVEGNRPPRTDAGQE